MNWKSTYERPVGIIGAGSFGTAMANLLAENARVMLYARKPEVVEQMRNERSSHGQQLHENITPVNDLEEVARECEVIFPVVPAAAFRKMMKTLAPYLRPYHIMIHGTKGLDVSDKQIDISGKRYTRDTVQTMSEVIREESAVVRIGCVAGPNLARELADKQPAATVIASHFDEVRLIGQHLLRSDRFQVYGSSDLIGIELCGVLKNIIAIGSGALSGLGLGENAKALLLSRGMVEMIHLGRAFGGSTEAFLGLAGIGDLIATCSSSLSRNFTVGNRLAKGESLEEILDTMEEVAEGVDTIRIVKHLAEEVNVRPPITNFLYKVLYEGLKPDEALHYLMKYPFYVDIDFIE